MARSPHERPTETNLGWALSNRSRKVLGQRPYTPPASLLTRQARASEACCQCARTWANCMRLLQRACTAADQAAKEAHSLWLCSLARAPAARWRAAPLSVATSRQVANPAARERLTMKTATRLSSCFLARLRQDKEEDGKNSAQVIADKVATADSPANRAPKKAGSP